MPIAGRKPKRSRWVQENAGTRVNGQLSGHVNDSQNEATASQPADVDDSIQVSNCLGP